ETFISGQGVLFDLLPPAFLEMSQSFLAMDNPKHDLLRRLVSSAFTPKQIGLIEDRIIGAARQVVDGFATEPSGEVEFVSSCTQKLPMQMFGDVMGIPESLRYAAAKGAQD